MIGVLEDLLLCHATEELLEGCSWPDEPNS